MISVLALALAIQPCVAPVHHKHKHALVAPLQSCAPPLRPPPTPAYVPDPEPIQIYVVYKYLIETPECPAPRAWLPHTFGGGGGRLVSAPEIDPGSGATAITLLAGCLAVMRARRAS